MMSSLSLHAASLLINNTGLELLHLVSETCAWSKIWGFAERSLREFCAPMQPSFVHQLGQGMWKNAAPFVHQLSQGLCTNMAEFCAPTQLRYVQKCHHICAPTWPSFVQ